MKAEFLAEIAGKEQPFYLNVRVQPGAPKTEFAEKMTDGTWKIRLAAVAEDNKANKELIRFFKKELGLAIEIVSGKTDRTKLIKITSHA